MAKRGSLPLRASFIASMVVAFGISGSKGSALSWAPFVSSSRTASDTVRPIAARTAAASSLIAPSMRVCTSWFAAMIGSPVGFVNYIVMHAKGKGKV